MGYKTSTQVFPYGAEETAFLSAADPALGAAIARYGHIDREVMPDLFAGLVFCIIGQQISSRAQETVWKRLQATLGNVTPDTVLSINADALRGCGLSGRKAGYIRAAAEAFQDGLLVPEDLRHMNDQEVVRALTALPGVGRWTAEMLLIFSLLRPNVLSYGDFGIRKGICRLHELVEVTPKQFEAYQQRYSPYATVASLYLWQIAGDSSFSQSSTTLS